MRIAFLCHRIPYPPNKGDKLRAFHQLRAMAERGHDVDLFTLADDPADLEHRSELAAYCRTVTVPTLSPVMARIRALAYLPTRQPLTLPYFYSRRLAAAVNSALRTEKYDRIFVYSSAMVQYVRDVTTPVITDFVDVDSDKWRQYAGFASFPSSLIYRREAVRLAVFERSVCRMSAASIVATEREADLLTQVCGTAPVHVVPNGIGEAPALAPDRAANAGVPPTVVFTGDMAYFPNAHAVDYFARSVLPEVRKQAADTRFLIVGRNPGRTVRALALLPGVEVTGTVPDVAVYLAQARVSVAPFLITAGIPNKILEAMNHGLPVVATSRAVQGLTSDAASAVVKADNPADMASVIASLLRNPEMSQRIGSEGRRVVTAAYNWKRSLEKFLNIIEQPSGALVSDVSSPKA